MKKILLSSILALSFMASNATTVASEQMIEKSNAIATYLNKESTSAELARAIVIFEKYSRSDSNMLYYLGLAHLEEKTNLITLNPKEGLNYIEEAAVLGNKDAQYKYAMFQIQNGSFEKGLKDLRESALNNNANAQHTLGRMYYQGNGVPKNKKNGFALIKASAENNNAEAQYDLAKIYFSQSDQDVQSGGVFWLNRAVANKNYLACDDLYKIYFAGILVEQDVKQHVKYLNCSALNGNSDAQLLLANYYSTGKYVPKSPHDAAVWYNKLAKSKNPEGIYNFALYSLKYKSKEKLVVKNVLKSLESNSSDHLPSANLVADIYMQGLYGVRQSNVMAVKFLERAKRLGDESAQTKIIFLLSEESKKNK
jgi:TPR repeat protein